MVFACDAAPHRPSPPGPIQSRTVVGGRPVRFLFEDRLFEGASVSQSVIQSLGRTSVHRRQEQELPSTQDNELLLLPHPDLAICESMRWQRRPLVRDRGMSWP